MDGVNDLIGRTFIYTCIVIAMAGWAIMWFLKHNPSVRDVAKEQSAKKAKSLLEKWLK